MGRKLIPMGLVAAFLAATLVGGTVLASGGDDGESATGAGADPWSSLETRVARILGTDPEATTNAIAEVNAALEVEYVDAVLHEAVEGGHLTTERAGAIRAQIRSGDYSGFDLLLQDGYEAACGVDPSLDDPYQDYANRVGKIIDVDGQRVAAAMDQASGEWYAEYSDPAASSDEPYPDDGPDRWTARIAKILGTDPAVMSDALLQVDAEIEAEYVDALLRTAVEGGRLTAERANAIRAEVQSGDYSALDHLWEESAEEQCLTALWWEDVPMASAEEYFGRIGAILKVDGQRVADAMAEAVGELYKLELGALEGASEPSEGEHTEKKPSEPAIAN